MPLSLSQTFPSVSVVVTDCCAVLCCPCCSLAGVSRSTTMVVAYLMTVTHYGWEECLSAVKAVRSFVGPNYGFQQQLQEYQTTRVTEVKRYECSETAVENTVVNGDMSQCVSLSECVGQQSATYHLP